MRELNRTQEWGFNDADFPTVPMDVQCNAGEVLVLAVYLPDAGDVSGLKRTIDALWHAVPNTVGLYRKAAASSVAGGVQLARLVQGVWSPGIRWVVLDLTTHTMVSPARALERASVSNLTLAGTELLCLLLLQPDWMKTWKRQGVKAPHLSGIRCSDGRSGVPQFVPYLMRTDDKGEREFFLNVCQETVGGEYYCSPILNRECV